MEMQQHVFTAAVSHPWDTSSLLNSWSNREHKAHCNCFSREAVQLYPPQLHHGMGPQPRQKQSYRHNSSNCLRDVQLLVPVLPSVRRHRIDRVLHFPVLWDTLMWSSTQELNFTLSACLVWTGHPASKTMQQSFKYSNPVYIKNPQWTAQF